MRHYYRILFLVWGLFFISGPVYAQQNLTVDLASDHVDITTGFNGSNLILFGMKDRKGDVAIVLRGPKHEMTVRKKNRVLGMWMNTEYMNFQDVPVFYDYAVSRDTSAGIEGRAFLKENGIGLDALVFAPEDAAPDNERIRTFQEALIRNNQAKGLFPVTPATIRFLNENFFRTTMYLPSNVPAGDYLIQTILFNDNKVIDITETSLRVAPVGLNAQIYKFAVHYSLYYGMLCVFIALFAGWIINVIRSK